MIHIGRGGQGGGEERKCLQNSEEIHQSDLFSGADYHVYLDPIKVGQGTAKILCGTLVWPNDTIKPAVSGHSLYDYYRGGGSAEETTWCPRLPLARFRQ